MTTLSKRFSTLFHPRSITFIGASNRKNKWGHIVLANLIDGGYEGDIYPVNQKEKQILNLDVFPDVKSVPEITDLAVIVTPPSTVPSLVNDCAEKGILSCVIISAGFAEVDETGRNLQKEITSIGKKRNMLIVGPNCNGIMSSDAKLYPMMPSLFPKPGNLAVVSQSGNIAVSMVSRGMPRGYGFRYYVSAGNEAVLTLADYIEFFAQDSGVKAILCYAEGIREGEQFLSVAKKTTPVKPIIMLKAGDTKAGSQAAFSHTASLSGSDAVFNAAIKRAGIIRADNLDDLFNTGAAFLRQPIPRGNRVGIITSGGGWGVLAADACSKVNLDVVKLPQKTIDALDRFLPPWWSRGNPVDLVAGLQDDAVQKSLEILSQCSQIDSILLLGLRGSQSEEKSDDKNRGRMTTLTSGDLFDYILSLMDTYQKPIILSTDVSFGDVDIGKALAEVLGPRNLLCHPTPNQAAQVLSNLVWYGGRAGR